MAFAPENLRPWFTDWPAIPEAIWRYTVPAGDTIDAVLASGYFDTADARLCAGSEVHVALPDMDGDGIAETVVLTVLKRGASSKPGSGALVAAGERARALDVANTLEQQARTEK